MAILVSNQHHCNRLGYQNDSVVKYYNWGPYNSLSISKERKSLEDYLQFLQPLSLLIFFLVVLKLNAKFPCHFYFYFNGIINMHTTQCLAPINFTQPCQPHEFNTDMNSHDYGLQGSALPRLSFIYNECYTLYFLALDILCRIKLCQPS